MSDLKVRSPGRETQEKQLKKNYPRKSTQDKQLKKTAHRLAGLRGHDVSCPYTGGDLKVARIVPRQKSTITKRKEKPNP